MSSVTLWLQCAGFSLWWLLLTWSTGARACGFSSCGRELSIHHRQALAHSLSNCSTGAYFSPWQVGNGDQASQGSSQCLWHWHAVSLPLSRQENPRKHTVGTSLMVKNLHCKAEDMGFIFGWETNIPHAMGQLSLCAATRELTWYEKSPCAATKIWCNQINKQMLKKKESMKFGLIFFLNPIW